MQTSTKISAYLKAISAGLLAGGLGALGWSVLSAWMQIQIGVFAWGIGVLVGFAVYAVAANFAGTTTGAIALACTTIAVALGKYLGIQFILSGLLSGGGGVGFDEADIIRLFARNRVATAVDAGETLVWPPGQSNETALNPDDFPENVWNEAKLKWDQLNAEDKRILVGDFSKAADAIRDEVLQEIRSRTLRENVNLFDLLWFLPAVVLSYLIGSTPHPEVSPHD